MPTYAIQGTDVEIARDSVIVDTGVLIGAFMSSDDKHLVAQLFLEERTEQFIVPLAVVIEAWGFVVGSRGSPQDGLKLLEWVLDPGSRTVIVPQVLGDLEAARETATAMHLDCVDAFLLHLAHALSTQYDLAVPIPIATCDLRDFARCVGTFRFNLIHLTAEHIEELSC